MTQAGEEFLCCARQVIEQADLLEKRWVSGKLLKPRLHIISQHYAFAIKAFTNMIHKNGMQDFNYSLHEGEAYEIIEEVKLLRSDIGVLCRDRYSRPIIDPLLQEAGLEFHPLFTTEPYVLISSRHPLARKPYLAPEDLNEYPRISFFAESDCDALYFSEDMEALAQDRLANNIDQSVTIISVKDRATMIHLLLGIDAYTLTAGLQGIDLYGDKIVALPFRVEATDFQQETGWIACKETALEQQVAQYVDELEAVAAQSKYE